MESLKSSGFMALMERSCALEEGMPSAWRDVMMGQLLLQRAAKDPHIVEVGKK
jgi:hypothetical protein